MAAPLQQPELSAAALKEQRYKPQHPGGAPHGKSKPPPTQEHSGAGPPTPSSPANCYGTTLGDSKFTFRREGGKKKSWHLCIFARSRHRKPSISLNPCFQGPILLPTDYESRLHILNKPLFTPAFNSLQCIMCMCTLAWQALTYCFDCYQPAMKGLIVLGSQDYIMAPTLGGLSRCLIKAGRWEGALQRWWRRARSSASFPRPALPVPCGSARSMPACPASSCCCSRW